MSGIVDGVPIGLMRLLVARGPETHVTVHCVHAGELASPAPSRSGDVAPDILVVAGERQWPRSVTPRTLALHAASVVSSHGIVYAVLPRRFRRPVLRELRRAGLDLVTSFVHVREATRLGHLVELSPGSVAYALRIFGQRRRLGRLAATIISQKPLREFAHWLLPSLGMVAQRPLSPPPLAWARGPSSGSPPPSAIVSERTSDRHVIHLIGGAQPALLKVEARSARLLEEASRLRTLARTLAAAGIRVPTLLGVESSPGGGAVLRQTLVPGIPASRLLSGRAEEVVPLLASLARALGEWHSSTLTFGAASDELLAEVIEDPASTLANHLPSHYWTWLMGRSRRWRRDPLPRVHVHLDLTMSNIFVDDAGSLAVVDWESARAEGLPLSDFFYAAADAAAAVHGYRARSAAFEDVFRPGGRYFAAVAAMSSALADRIGLPPSAMELCFHACWLHHARNEGAARSSDRPFLAIMQLVAANAPFFEDTSRC